MNLLVSTFLLGGLCLSAGLVNLAYTSEATACTLPADTSTKNPPKK